MACCDLLLVLCRRLQRSAKHKYTHYRSTYCLVIRGADVTVWDSDPWKSQVWAFERKREITGEPLNSRSQILAPKWREITGVDCTVVTLGTHRGSACLCRCAFRYHRILCLGRNSDTHMESSCQPWRKTEPFGFSFESEPSSSELVGDVGLASHRNHEWLPPHSRRFCGKHRVDVIAMVKGLRLVLEGFIVTMHEDACETRSQIPRALARRIWRTVRTSPSALWQ